MIFIKDANSAFLSSVRTILLFSVENLNLFGLYISNIFKGVKDVWKDYKWNDYNCDGFSILCYI